MSLSPRPDTVSTTTSSGLKVIFDSAATACALSMAGLYASLGVHACQLVTGAYGLVVVYGHHLLASCLCQMRVHGAYARVVESG